MQLKVERPFAIYVLVGVLAVLVVHSSAVPAFAPQSSIPQSGSSTTKPLSGTIQICCGGAGTQDDAFVLSGGGGADGSTATTTTNTTETAQFAQTTTDVLAFSSSSPSTPTGLVVPLYANPGPVWAALISTKESNPSIPVIAIINPSSGVGTRSATYASYVASLQQAGILVLGYDWSNYGITDGGGQYYTTQQDIENNMTDYSDWYHVNGTFFDGEAYTAGYEDDYAQWVSFAQNLGQTYTMGNPGTDTLASYVGITNNVNVYEDGPLPSASSLGGWHTNYAKSEFAFIAYSVNSVPSQSYIDAASQYVGYLYVSDQGDGYQTLPSYLNELMQELSVADG